MSLTEISSSLDLVDRPILRPFQHFAERLDQVEQTYRKAGIVILRDELLHLRIRPDVFFDDALLLQHLGRVLEALVFEQPLDQFLARVLFGFTFLAQRRIGRQQQARLDVDQRRGHEDELRADVEIHLARLIQIGEVLRGDGRDRNIADVDLLFADQIQQQIERSVVLIEMNVQRR